MDEKVKDSVELVREIGKVCLFGSDGDAKKKDLGLQLILEAHGKKDPEATFIVSRLILDGVLKTNAENQTEYALTLMCSAANKGCLQARAYLNAYCEERYREECGDGTTDVQGASLVDFDGKPIRIDRQGIFTPVDAVLECKDGQNILTLSANILFLYGDEVCDPELFEQAIHDGIMAWQGDYEVFGGQKLTVKISLTYDNAFDSVVIMPFSEEMSSTLQAVTQLIGTKERKALIEDIVAGKRSFAVHGFKWTTTSRKVIFLQSENGRFDDYDELMNVTKHEFGHALGLGDLYASTVDSLEGVEKGTYDELDSYAIRDKYYNLVMCDHRGPISNNDIEMVVLAFRENKMQLYQPGKLKEKISSALGKGN